MADPDPHDDTSADSDRVEHAQFAPDCDTAGVTTADIDDATAQHLVTDLVDADTVTPVPVGRVLVHEPSGTAFESIEQLAVFHRGWTAGRDADRESE
jgi:hypothetical protein